MTSRTYDVALYLSNASNFSAGQIVVGNTSKTIGTVISSNTSANSIKVKLANTLQEYVASEFVHVNSISISGTANGALDTNSLPFVSNVMSGNVTVASSDILYVRPSGFIAEKNSFIQNPIVRLYTIYYPGEWYPPNEFGNPTQLGEGRAWPDPFPLKFAEIVGDIANDLSYNVTYGGTSYLPFPVSVSGLEQSYDGKINELSVTIFNVDNIISNLVEDPYIAGNNTSNSVVAYVNGTLVHGIDPRTVNATPESFDVGTEGYDTLTRARANGLLYSEDLVSLYGKANASFNREQTLSIGGTWKAQKTDSRDLLGGIVEIKTTFANFLDYWPEYSLSTGTGSNVIEVINSAPYRPGDRLISVSGGVPVSLDRIDGNTLYLDKDLPYYSPNEFPNSTDIYAWYRPRRGSDTGVDCLVTRDYFETPVGYTPLKMEITGSNPTLASFDSNVWNLVTANVADTFVLSGYTKASTNTLISIRLIGADATGDITSNGIGLASSTKYFNTTTQWSRFEHHITIANTLVENIQIRLNGNTGTGSGIVVWWDGLQLEKSNTTTASDFVPEYRADTIPDSGIGTVSSGDPIYIVNEDADSESFLQDTYKIDQLESLNNYVATFGLISWLQYFKIVQPKRKYYKNTCQWKYKGPECQYPESGSGNIPGTNLNATGFYDISNNSTTEENDVCAKSYRACSIRNNSIHYGGFIGTGRTVPRA